MKPEQYAKFIGDTTDDPYGAIIHEFKQALLHGEASVFIDIPDTFEGRPLTLLIGLYWEKHIGYDGRVFLELWVPATLKRRVGEPGVVGTLEIMTNPKRLGRYYVHIQDVAVEEMLERAVGRLLEVTDARS